MTLKNYLKPKTAQEAVTLFSDHENVFFLAGGTEVNSRNFKFSPDSLIDISNLGFNSTKYDNSVLKIGSMVSIEDIKIMDYKDYPSLNILKTAASNISNRNIRNQATLGGNICACKSCSDMIPILLVMNASVTIHTLEKAECLIPLNEYIETPKKDLISSINIPVAKNTWHASICRYTRTANDLALVTVALGLDIREGECHDARVAIGGIASKPCRITKIENALKGQKLESRLSELVLRLEPIISESIEPIDDHRGTAEYKKLLTKGLFTDALYSAAAKGGIRL